jgi:hypothetical protein
VAFLGRMDKTALDTDAIKVYTSEEFNSCPPSSVPYSNKFIVIKGAVRGTGFDLETLGLLGDLDSLRECQGTYKTYLLDRSFDTWSVTDKRKFNHNHVAISHRQLYEDTVGRDRPLRVINSLSNPMNIGHAPPHGADDGAYAFNHTAGRKGAHGFVYPLGTNALSFGFPLQDKRWAIASSAGGLTGNHVDTNGLYTYTDVVAGRKLWIHFVLDKTQFTSHERFLESHGYGPYGHPDWKVVGILLREGERA